MGIERVIIHNYKSIKDLDIRVRDSGLTCFIGKNGSGKTTIMEAISYLYDVSKSHFNIKDVIDKKNPYVQKAFIEIHFDFSNLFKIERVANELNDYSQYFVDSTTLPIRLTQLKDGTVEWYPLKNEFDVKKILSYFPYYFITPQQLSAPSWDDIWSVVSDIAVSMQSDEEEKKLQLLSVFSDIYGPGFEKTYNKIKTVLEDENISINQTDYRSLYKHAILTCFGGNRFLLDDELMDYYSLGINSFVFLRLYIRFLEELSIAASKEICILIDEMEMSLHPQLIDDLAEVFNKKGRKQFIISTHSPHLVSSLVNQGCNICFYKIYQSKGYTYYKDYSSIVNRGKNHIITDNESVGYFSNAILFVEGQSEVQIFTNKKLLDLLPVFRKITVYNTNSDTQNSDYLLPGGGDKSINYLIVLDMDKLLSYSLTRRKFKCVRSGKLINPFANSKIRQIERYSFNDLRNKTYHEKQYIDNILTKTFQVDNDNFLQVNGDYYDLLKHVKRYCYSYNVFPITTTIEGALICEASFDCFVRWLKECKFHNNSNRYNELILDLKPYDRNKQINILRSIFKGKLDNFKSYKERNYHVGTSVKGIIDKYSDICSAKTDGWNCEFINWVIGIYLKDVNDKSKSFLSLFPEIKSIYFAVENML